ncbi:MAG: cytochrome c biogenesis protein CcsA [Phycisphaerae bacterium]
MRDSSVCRGRVIGAAFALMTGAGLAFPSLASVQPFAASERAIGLDKQIDWSAARLIAVQDGGRYKTLDSFARESFSAMYGKEHLPGLTPVASLMEWLFNRDAYADAPVVRVKDKGIQIHFTAHMPEAARQRILNTGYMTPNELRDPVVRQRMDELEPRAIMVTAMRRVRNAEAVALMMDRMFRIVPDPSEKITPAHPEPDYAWYTPNELRANLPDEIYASAGTTREQMIRQFGGPVPDVSAEQALGVIGPWASLQGAWLRGDAAGVQEALRKLSTTLPALAQPGIYPSHSQRAAEARYYRMGKFTWGWTLYFIGALFGVVALAASWRWAWWTSMVLLLAGIGFHGYGVALRWYILDRIPVANMFEAVVGAALVGIGVGLLAELYFRSAIFLVASHATGFVSLMLGSFVIPGGGTITSIMGILDDVMLRIHTTLIIASYALIFLAAVIALMYLFAYYVHTQPTRSATVGLMSAGAGAALLLAAGMAFRTGGAEQASGLVKSALVTPVAAYAAVALLLLVPVLRLASIGSLETIGVLIGGIACGALAIGNYGFTSGLALTMIGGGLVWAGGNGLALLLRRNAPALATAPGLALAGGGSLPMPELSRARPLMAGAMPGDEKSGRLPAWMNDFDWAHLIILNLVFVMLFVGIILGAIWADYSWGRPWGWDPKEVFALNTWIIYAILIHTRFIVKNKGLWTAWLSVLGCLMMAFNWCFVNFFIVGLHSYA